MGADALLQPPATPAQWAVYALAVHGALVICLRLWRLARILWERRGPPPMISFLVMVRNQAHQIEGALRSLAALIRSHRADCRCELVVVDSGSQDETPRIIERLARELPGVRLLRLGEHLGHGASAWTVGMFACQSRVVVCLDLVGAAPARTLLRTLAALVGHKGPLSWL